MRKPLAVGVLAVLLILFPWLPKIPLSVVINANLAGEFALIAISLVILTGWVGQISLGQGSFVGIGAFATGLLARSLHIPFPANLPIVALLAAGIATLLGLVALRVRGLYLAVATLIFAWMADAYLFTASWLVGKGGASSISNRVIGQPGTLPLFDFSNKRVFYLVILAAVAATLYVADNLRNSKTGRAFFAIRGSEMAAVSLGIDVTKYKLLAFALSGALAGIAGNLMMTDLRTASPVSFQFTVSLFYLSIAVVGGITSLGGAVSASLLFAGLNEAFFRLRFLNGWLDIVTVGLLLAVLVGYPGGLGALGPALMRRARALGTIVSNRMKSVKGPMEPQRSELRAGDLRQRGSRRGRLRLRLREAKGSAAFGVMGKRMVRSIRRTVPGHLRRRVSSHVLDMSSLTSQDKESVQDRLEQSAASPAEGKPLGTGAFPLPANRAERNPILEVDHVTVRFGGLTAVDDVSLQVREHEIVGLIGPNGAGKTTLFNAISGLNEPSAGVVHLYGEDATSYPVHIRAKMGVGRTFQLIQLFPQLSVFDNILVATHVHNKTGVFSHLALTDKAIQAERVARAQTRQIIELMDLEDVADRRVAGLPFGLLRRVEIARSLVTRAPLMMLDEPASGLDNSETDQLAEFLHLVRSALGVTILLIEHDVRMVTSVSDYMYVVNQGALLAEGTPIEIQRHPEVISAYLGSSHTVDAGRV